MVVYVGIIILLSVWIWTDVSGSQVDDLCVSILDKDYKFFETPSEGNPVYVSMDITDIGEIDEEKMDYMLKVYIRSTWEERRIDVKAVDAVSGITSLPKDCLSYYWKPDIFFENAKTIEMFKSMPSINVYVDSEQKITVVTRYLIRASCKMYFKNFPFDSQVCSFFVALISPDSEAILHWSYDSKDIKHRKLKRAVRVLREIQPLQFTLGDIRTSTIVDVLPDANYTTLVAEVVFNRRLVESVINTFIPSTLIVTMSWIGFWLGTDAVPARTGLSITSLLTLCTQSHQYQSKLPPVNYIKAMDIWFFTCLFLVFSTLIEFAIVYNLKRKSIISKNQMMSEQQKEEIHPITSSETSNIKRNISATSVKSENLTYSHIKFKIASSLVSLENGDSVDRISRIVYLGFFLFFAAFYWIHYLRIYFTQK